MTERKLCPHTQEVHCVCLESIPSSLRWASAQERHGCEGRGDLAGVDSFDLLMQRQSRASSSQETKLLTLALLQTVEDSQTVQQSGLPMDFPFTAKAPCCRMPAITYHDFMGRSGRLD